LGKQQVAAGRLAGIIDELLDFSATEYNDVKLSPAALNFRQVLAA
jgi:hypothetical protein